MARRIRRSQSGSTNKLFRARPGAIVIAALALLLAAVGVALAGPAGTILSQDPTVPKGLAKAGPVSPANGFPDWYKDKEGVALEPCIDPKDPMCIMGAMADVNAPLKLDSADPAQNNFPDEFFYWNGGALLDSVGVPDARGRAGKASLIMALEGAFGGGVPKTNDQMAFARFRFRVTGGLTPNSHYKVYYPYGTADVTTDPGDPSLFVTEDIGITPGAFSEALAGRIGPFLRWNNIPNDPAGPLPDGYLGDPTVDHTVTGSPVNQNFFALVGPNAGVSAGATQCTPAQRQLVGNPAAEDCAFTDLFAIMGKKSVRGGVEVHSATYSRSADGATTKLDVLAESKDAQNIQVSDPDPARRPRLFPTTQADADNGDYLAHITLPGGGVAPDTVAVSNFSDVPRTLKTPHLTDRVTGTAVYDTDLDRLHVEAASSDKSSDGSGPSAQLKLPFYNQQLTPVAADPDHKQQGDIALSAPPATITVTSSRDGEVVLPVTVTGSDSAIGALRADAGPNRTIAPNRPLNLDGSSSSGNIDSYAWTGPYNVTDNGDGTFTLGALKAGGGPRGNTAVAGITAPGADGLYGYRLTVAGAATGAGDRLSDDMVLTVQTPAALNEQLAFTSALYRGDQQRWVVDGTSSVNTNGNDVTVYNGPNASGAVIGTAVVDRLNAWLLDVRDSAIVPDPCTCVSIRSGLGTTVENFALNITKPPPPALAAAAAAPAAAAFAAVPGVGALARTAPAAVAAPRVALTARVTPASAATAGIPVTVTVPAGAKVLRLRLLTARGQVLVQSFRTVKGGTKVRLRLKAKRLRRQQRYALQTVAGTSRTHLGRATTVRFRVR